VKSRLLRARLQLRERLGRYFQRRDDGRSGDKHVDDKTKDVSSGDGNQ